MLIVPLVCTSILVGVAGLGSGRDPGRLGTKAALYCLGSSLLAILVGQVLVTLFWPGAGANLGLQPLLGETLSQGISARDQILGIVPESIFAALGDNRAVLQRIPGSLLFGIFLGRAPAPNRERVLDFFSRACSPWSCRSPAACCA
jgi:Na+/H+-dicarboxylate symporter